MNSERWQRIEALFQSALELEPAARAAYLAEASGNDLQIKAEVEALLFAHSSAGSFIESPILDKQQHPRTDYAGNDATTVSLSVEEQEQLMQPRVGPYKLLQEIGRGGMGTVYLAARDDDQFQKRVAIKLVKRGMDTDFVLRRFRNERQILASLDHPGIARLLDGGTAETGLPYFVMEYIEGLSIDKYCDTHKLSTVERLQLFIQVCSAVHYAHQNLVIHRDIKPGNILITSDGSPKLLDFGIAKLLNPEFSSQTVDPTAVSMRLMTPEYASPEQVRGEPITTASDIYSLGVLLYELLTGHRPYYLTSRLPHEIVRVICEQEPEKPSTAVGKHETIGGRDGRGTRIEVTPDSVSRSRGVQVDKLQRRLKGDIDNIVLMAMKKEPQRRYSSVDQLASDIKRHLEGMPVIARKDTFVYRTAKFVRRNVAGVAAALLILVILIGGAISTMRERARAERRFNDVRKLANSFMFEIHDAIDMLPGSTSARELLVRRALEYLDSLAKESTDDPSLQRELATSYQKVGEVQGRPATANLGDTSGALDSCMKALAIREKLVEQEPDNKEDRRALATIYSRTAELLESTGESQASMDRYRKALAIREQLYAENPTDSATKRDLAISYFEIAEGQVNLGDIEGALESRRKMLPMFEALQSADPGNSTTRRNVALSHKKLGATLARLDRFEESLGHYRKALEIEEALSSANPTNALFRMDVSYSISDIGFVLGRLGRHEESLSSYERALDIRQSLVDADSKDQRARSALATTLSRIGRIHTTLGNMPAAMEHFRKALSIRESTVASDPVNVSARRGLGELYADMGESLAQFAATSPAAGNKAQYWRDARSWYQRSIDVFVELRNKGQSVSAADIDDLTQKMARCDGELKKLKG
jgi:non-specific serine/threonine protein kinase/serine/threonine-protein kinase